MSCAASKPLVWSQSVGSEATISNSSPRPSTKPVTRSSSDGAPATPSRTATVVAGLELLGQELAGEHPAGEVVGRHERRRPVPSGNVVVDRATSASFCRCYVRGSSASSSSSSLARSRSRHRRRHDNRRTGQLVPCLSLHVVDQAFDRGTSGYAAVPTIRATILCWLSGLGTSSPTLRPRRMTTARSATSVT